MFPHILHLQGLGICPVITSEYYEVLIYSWYLDTSAGQAPLTVRVNSSWLLPEED